jgi:hypothetical protein
MGYSISIQVSSNPLRKKLLDFMGVNYRRWSVVCGKDPSEWSGSSRGPTDDISYGVDKTSIGFDYGPMQGFERDYIYSVLRWMAIKVGDRKLEMNTDEDEYGPDEPVTFSEPIPYYRYDCDSHFTPILVVTKEQEAALLKDHRHWAVDEWGVRVGPTSIDHQIGSCSGVFFGPTSAHILADSKILGPAPKEDGEARDSWMALHQAIYLKYLKPELDENIALIRQEIQRLDQLWTSEL